MSSSSPNAKPKKLFVVGMHRSGTSILADLLKAHPAIAGHEIAEMPPELENEGQHVQSVFDADDALGPLVAKAARGPSREEEFNELARDVADFARLRTSTSEDVVDFGDNFDGQCDVGCRLPQLSVNSTVVKQCHG